MRQKRFLWLVLGIAVVSLTDCAQNVSSPRESAAPAGVTVTPNESVHGVLNVPAAGQSGIQGATEPFLLGDDGRTFALELGAGLDALRDPASSGRGITLNGDLLTRSPVPVGANERTIIVSSFEFDSE